VAAVTAKILGILHSEAAALSGDKSLLGKFNIWRITQ